VATLKIKNESGAKIEFATPAGAVKLDAGASAELNEQQLKSTALADAMLLGKVSLTTPANPSAEQIALAKAVLPPIVTGARARLTQLKARFDQSQAELLRLRDAFNKTWKVAEASLGATKSGVSGWPTVRKAVKALILDAERESAEVTDKRDALKALQKELKDLKKEDLGQSGRSLEDWYQDRAALERAIAEATEALDSLARRQSNPLVAELESIEEHIGVIDALKADKAIGGEIPKFGP
jgi:small-conductance mechanosensitive channel